MATQQQLDNLRAAIAIGATTVRDGDKSTTYRSLSEMRDIEKSLSADLGVPSAYGGSQKRYSWTNYFKS